MTSDSDQMYIEDESGRLRLIGDKLKSVNRDWKCVTGACAYGSGCSTTLLAQRLLRPQAS